MTYQHKAKETLILVASLVAAHLQVGAAHKSNVKSTPMANTQAVKTQTTSVQNKPSRLLSGSVAYGTQH